MTEGVTLDESIDKTVVVAELGEVEIEGTTMFVRQDCVPVVFASVDVHVELTLSDVAGIDAAVVALHSLVVAVVSVVVDVAAAVVLVVHYIVVVVNVGLSVTTTCVGYYS